MTASPQAQTPAPEPEAARGLAALFGGKPAEASGLGASASSAVLDGGSVFAESVEIEGSLEGEGDVVLRGQVRGSISITGTLVVAENGRVHADVSAREVVCGGTVEGNIRASEKVRVESTGLVQGDIDSPSIVIDDGGGVEGFVQMEPPGSEDLPDDAPPPAPPAAGRLGRSAARAPDAPPRLTREMLMGLDTALPAPPASGLLNRPARAPAAQPLAAPLPPSTPVGVTPEELLGDGPDPLEDPLRDVLEAGALDDGPLLPPEPLGDGSERPIPDL